MKEVIEIQFSDVEIKMLNETIFLKYGYDFSEYSQTSYSRRIKRVMNNYKIISLAELQFRLMDNELFFNLFVEEITVNVTEMFRDSDFYKALRNDVLPQLSTYPMIRIWHAGCSTGEEVYSMAILLKEAGLLEKSILYATDINQAVLEKAASASFSYDSMKEYSENYLECGGLFDLSDYYISKNGKSIFSDELKSRMVFSPHNLVLDQSFNEFNLIICRNVLIYFNRELQARVINLFCDSLANFGFLALGNKESIDLNFTKKKLVIINKKQRIWRK